MSALLVLLVGGVAATVAWSWLAHRGGRSRVPRRRSGEGPLGVRSAAEVAELRASMEAEDLEQLLAATNARRRARGLPERTREDADRTFGAGIWSGRG